MLKNRMVLIQRSVFLLLGLLPLTAITVDLTGDRHDFVNYFSNFTIIVNLLASGLFFHFAIFENRQKSSFFESFRGATLGYLIIAAAVYYLLLRDLPGDPIVPVIPWVNNALHYYIPLATIVHWVLVPPTVRLRYKHIFLWLLFPVIFLIYSLIRGGTTGWYPYPFLDPRASGYIPVIKFSVAMIIIGVFLSILIITTGNKLKRLKV